MAADRPRVGPEMLAVKGQAAAAPDVAPPAAPPVTRPPAATDLSTLARQRKAGVTFTLRLDTETHEKLRRLAFENNASIQAIIMEALKRMGI